MGVCASLGICESSDETNVEVEYVFAGTRSVSNRLKGNRISQSRSNLLLFYFCAFRKERGRRKPTKRSFEFYYRSSCSFSFLIIKKNTEKKKKIKLLNELLRDVRNVVP